MGVELSFPKGSAGSTSLRLDGVIFDDKDWVKLTHMVIDHGRTICVARHPRCSECILVDLCPSADV